MTEILQCCTITRSVGNGSSEPDWLIAFQHGEVGVGFRMQVLHVWMMKTTMCLPAGLQV
jgi:hypothetical protein